MTKDTTLTYRVGQLEKQADEIDKKLDLIMSNHLYHLRTDMVSLKTKVNVLTAINVGAMIIGIIVTKVLQ